MSLSMMPQNDLSESIIKTIWHLLENVPDPEIPVLSVVDLGIIREVLVSNQEESSITILFTPTYSGCPAMDMIRIQIRMALLKEGFNNIILQEVLSPAWTTDWISDYGKNKLKAYGIAPPQYQSSNNHSALFQEEQLIHCPKCNSQNTRLISQFGSTACKALYQCNNCKEPFDYFKCH